jgi:cytochrome d ubiquinol oxidase subunit II
MHMSLDYEALRVIWWGLLGVLLIGFTLTDGFDLGVAALLPFAARTDDERRMTINTIAPTWEGNQVWFILGGGAIFAAWPFVYAVAFSGFYLAMFLVLATLILRPVAFKYRSKRPSAGWRLFWDWALFAGGVVPALVFGVAVGNVLQGAPFKFDDDLRIAYLGSFLGLFTPFTLLCGLLSVSMVSMHGAAFLTCKAEHGMVRHRARTYGGWAAAATVILFALGGAFVTWGGLGYRLASPADPSGASNPLHSEVVRASGAYLANYVHFPWMLIAPALGVFGPLLAQIGLRKGREAPAFAGSSLSAVGIISTVGLSMFPIILPSSSDAHSGLTVWNASSSHATLLNMLVATIIPLPIVLAYTAWVFKVLWGRTDTAAILASHDYY